MPYKKNFLITIIALVFVILKHSLQWRGEFHLYFGPVPEFLLVNSAARRFSMAASFEGIFLSSFLSWCFHWPYLVVQVYELITCVRRANENAGNLISGVQFLINIYIYIKPGFIRNSCCQLKRCTPQDLVLVTQCLQSALGHFVMIQC